MSGKSTEKLKSFILLSQLLIFSLRQFSEELLGEIYSTFLHFENVWLLLTITNCKRVIIKTFNNLYLMSIDQSEYTRQYISDDYTRKQQLNSCQYLTTRIYPKSE